MIDKVFIKDYVEDILEAKDEESLNTALNVAFGTRQKHLGFSQKVSPAQREQLLEMFANEDRDGSSNIEIALGLGMRSQQLRWGITALFLLDSDLSEEDKTALTGVFKAKIIGEGDAISIKRPELPVNSHTPNGADFATSGFARGSRPNGKMPVFRGCE